jgi:molecular chaperone HtpG
MQRIGQREDIGRSQRILELNPEHPVVQALKQLHQSRPDDPRIVNYGRLLYEEAVITEGSKLEDPAAFTRRINELLIKDASV